MLTLSALLLFVGLALATIAGVIPILSRSIILVNGHSQIKGNYHLYPLIYLSVGQVLSLTFFFFGWASHPTKLVMKWYLVLCVVVWIFVLALALILYVSFRLGWPGL
jgi:Mn2+/Fe2+ NRAMP family transporter